MQKVVQLKVRGMQRDLSVSAFNPEYSYENKNIRIMSTDDSTLLSIINEKGNKECTIEGIGNELEGIPIGQVVINDILVIFTTDNSIDRIYRIEVSKDTLTGKKLFEGSLNFNTSNPIEAVVFYETENIIKVYWTDGVNQPRIINIAADDEAISNWNNNSFDFIRVLELKEDISIERSTSTGGMFAPGVIQYYLSYYSKYGQESNIFYSSPLYYTSYEDRGGSPEDKVGNSFKIDLKNLDKSFDYVRIYSILRTSKDSTVEAKIVADLAIPSSGNIIYVDNGVVGTSIDPSEILYTGGESISAYTMEHKDNTLFLGNIKLKTKIVSKEIRDYFRNQSVSFGYLKSINSPEAKGTYPYINQLRYNSNKIKIFKYLEWYRFGIQGQYNTGKWSEPIFIKDIQNTLHVRGSYTYKEELQLPGAMMNLTGSILELMRNQGFIKVRPVIVYPTSADRECICQGVLCPTVYNVSDRYGNSPFSQSSWFTRPNCPYDINNASKDCIIFTMDSAASGMKPGGYNVKGDSGDTSIDAVVVDTVTNKDGITRAIARRVLNASVFYPESGRLVASDGSGTSYNFTSYEYSGDWTDRDEIFKYSINSRMGVSSNDRTILTVNGNDKLDMDMINKGAWAEFRHNYPIPSNNLRNAEIQCIFNPPSSPNLASSMQESQIAEWVSANAENFYIDQSILTFHSPDIEFNDDIKNLDTSSLKLRIVGIVPLTGFTGDIDIQTSTPPNNYTGAEGKITSDVAPGFYKESVNAENISRFGWKGLMSGAFWFDDLSDYKSGTENSKQLTTGFVVYPWHRNGSLNNTKNPTDGYKSAMLEHKRLSNLRFSYNSYYLDSSSIWNAYVQDDNKHTGISGVSIFNSNEVSLVRLRAQENSGLGDINYYGNIDKIINISRIGDKKDGYPIVVTGVQDEKENAHLLFTANYKALDSTYTDTITGVDPVRMTYKSSPHAVLALNYTKTNEQVILPTVIEGTTSFSGENTWKVNYLGGAGNGSPFWNKTRTTQDIYQDILEIKPEYRLSLNGIGVEYGFLWLGELYNDGVTNRFGGTSEEALENNEWLPCGESISLYKETGDPETVIDIIWSEGDTYYQRYDHLKTYPFTQEDQNSITDIISFMCETRVNIDGRYDRNRGQYTNFIVTPENFNLLNDVYSQDNNFIIYRALNYDKFNLDSFPNSIIWTKEKQVANIIDSWTNVVLTSVLDLDGDKGEVRSIKRFNNELIAFQDRGISNILFNSRTQLSTTEGVPVEIANSGKVDGKRYITDKIGCTNKWSICESPNGLYFIDDITKGIYLLNSKLDNISDRLGFHSWINSESTEVSIWDPVNFKGFVSYYDRVNGDVLFINKDHCLMFSEPINQFTSFCSYEDTPYFFNISDRGFFINKERGGDKYKLWGHNEGDYNKFFGRYEPFYMTFIINPDKGSDKIFNTIEFRADSWNGTQLLDSTFDTLETWNEYQKGKISLVNTKDRPSSLKKKFRIWRANIPRDSVNKRDRMRNPWLYLKLSMETENINKTIFHDLIVNYFE